MGTTYVPVSCGVNLWLNFIAGICIWDDWNRLTHRLAYVFVFILVFLGTYGLSSFDLAPASLKEEEVELEATLRKNKEAEKQTECPPLDRRRTSKRLTTRRFSPSLGGKQPTIFQQTLVNLTLPAHLDYLQDPLRRLGVDLWTAWMDDPANVDETKWVLREYLKHAINRSLIDAHGLADLCLELLEEQHASSSEFYTPALERWLVKQVETFEECRAEALSDDDDSEDQGESDDSGLDPITERATERSEA